MASSPNASPAGRSHGRWTTGALLGQGPLGQVFLAHDAAGHAAALTVVHAALARDEGFRARFAREIDALGAVRGPRGRRTASLVDADPQGVVPWLAVEYVAGPTLAARVRRGVGRGAAVGRSVWRSCVAWRARLPGH